MELKLILIASANPALFERLLSIRKIIQDKSNIELLAVMEKLYTGSPIKREHLTDHCLHNKIEIPLSRINEIDDEISMNSLSSSVIYENYIELLTVKYVRTRIKEIALMSKDLKLNDIKALLEADIIDISPNETNAVRHVKDVISELQKEDKIEHINFGIKHFLDRQGGFRRGELVVIAARPSVGKSTYAVNMLKQVLKDDRKIYFQSAEMPGYQIVRKLICSATGIYEYKIETRAMDKTDKEHMENYIQSIDKSNLYIDDTCSIDIDDMCLKFNRLHKEKNFDVMFIDHLHTLQVRKHETTFDKLDYAIAKLKKLAADNKIVIICLAQLNRAGDQGESPKYSDLRGCGSIEQVADVIIMMQKMDGDKIKNVILKNRLGQTGIYETNFEKAISRIKEWS